MKCIFLFQKDKKEEETKSKKAGPVDEFSEDNIPTEGAKSLIKKTCCFLLPRKDWQQQTITLKMVDQRMYDICVVFTMSLCPLELKQTLISLVFQVIRFLNKINRL